MSVDEVVDNVFELGQAPSDFKRVVNIRLRQLGNELLNLFSHCSLLPTILVVNE
jgi:hypothetical protein